MKNEIDLKNEKLVNNMYNEISHIILKKQNHDDLSN